MNWKESTNLHTGIINGVSELGYEVIYDDLVDGAPCVEKNISPARLQPIAPNKLVCSRYSGNLNKLTSIFSGSIN